MDEQKVGVDWPPAVTNFVITLFSYTNLNCSGSYTKYLFLPEITVQKLYK